MAEKIWRQLHKLRFHSILVVGIGFLLVALLLLGERRGVSAGRQDFVSAMLSEKKLASLDTDKPVDADPTCLFLWNSEEETSTMAREDLAVMLRDMRVPVREIDVAEFEDSDETEEPNQSNGGTGENSRERSETERRAEDDRDLLNDRQRLAAFRTIVVAMNDLDGVSEYIFSLCEYVENGGRMLFALTPAKTHTFNAIAARIGVVGSGDDNKLVNGFQFADGFLIGGDGLTISIEDPYEAALNLGVDSQSRVYMSGMKDQTPLIWERDYGDGKFVVTNFGYTGKVYRGIYAAAYSLLEDVSVWPVINASSFYLDDFPSPVPEGDSTWIRRDYDMDTTGFYADVWWPDVMSLIRKYGIRYTGVIIETYSDQVSGRLKRNQNTSNFYYYGNMLLNAGGELGFHGYNHQPLVGKNFHYQEDLGYRKWDSAKEMQYAMQELYTFASRIYPDTTFQVYVPPSNILSDEARQMIGQGDMPGVRAVASSYLPGGSVYAQEFEVAKDGITESPRVISGAIFDDYNKLAAFSELNLHFVNSHFMHPDDLMDPDRGAKLGWKELKKRLTAYLDWLTGSAPQLQMTSGSEMAGRVQRFCAVSLKRTKSTAREEQIHVNGLVDEAWCLVRFNRGEPGEVKGGDITRITGDLYLLHVTDPDVTIEVN